MCERCASKYEPTVPKGRLVDAQGPSCVLSVPVKDARGSEIRRRAAAGDDRGRRVKIMVANAESWLVVI